MKFAVLATLATAAVAFEAAANATTAPPKVTTICTSSQVSTINELESSETYNTCRSDAQKQIFDGSPTDICATPSCKVAVQGLVLQYPKCVFDNRTPYNDIQPYITACGADPTLKVTPAPTKTTRPVATLPSGSNSTDGTITVAPTTGPTITAAPRTKVAPTTAAPSGAVANTASLIALGSAALALVMA
ncbi:hypothetical protein ACHHYP_14321 [Achlya hypogyna]|uniref:Secreted protein n=1 Tax=Achlya hypogyna TaxID=1202772 RepID=A0A0A7CPE1_ACHHY|nr:secreted protein [Achlya hypogyna]OQR83749.1 hypothetical protein ACHHYP_14321 [Achlya hypogyna]